MRRVLFGAVMLSVLWGPAIAFSDSTQNDRPIYGSAGAGVEKVERLQAQVPRVYKMRRIPANLRMGILPSRQAVAMPPNEKVRMPSDPLKNGLQKTGLMQPVEVVEPVTSRRLPSSVSPQRVQIQDPIEPVIADRAAS